MQGKWKEKAVKSLFIGFADDHPPDTYRMLSLKTDKVFTSCNVRWADWERLDPKQDSSVFTKSPIAEDLPVGLPDDDSLYDAKHYEPNNHKSAEANAAAKLKVRFDTAAGRKLVDLGNNRYAALVDDDDTTVADDEEEVSQNFPRAAPDPVPIVLDQEDAADQTDDEERDDVVAPPSTTPARSLRPRVTIKRMNLAGGNAKTYESDVVETEHLRSNATSQADDNELHHQMQGVIARAEQVAREMEDAANTIAPQPQSMDRAVVEDDRDGAAPTQVHFVFMTEAMSDPGEPKTFKEAWNGPDKHKWRPSISSEISNFTERGSWVIVPRAEAKASGKSIIKTKYVFKVKDEVNGKRYKTRLVSKGYAFVQGVDYHESYSPVSQDTSVRMAIAIGLYHWQLGWTIELVDVTAAFLEGPITDPVYLEWPEGFVEMKIITEEEKASKVIKLVKGMYGNPDAALLFFKEYSRLLMNPNGMAMHQCKSDPCVFTKHDAGKLVLLALTHVDDTMLVGDPKWIQWFKDGLKTRFKFTEQGKLKKHLGVDYEWYQTEDGKPYIIAWMPKMVKQIIKMYTDYKGSAPKPQDSPGTPSTSLVSNPGEAVDASDYRSIVGKVMYLVVKLWAAGSNAARELTRFFANPGKEHWKEVDRMVGYFIAHEDDIYLRYDVPNELRPGAMCDSNHATNVEDRHSVSGGLFTLGGVLVNWLSRTQPYVCLSSTESEMGAHVTGLQEVLFQLNLLEELKIGCKPAVMMIDNTAVIYMIKNNNVSSYIKHIHICFKFYVEHYHELKNYVPVYI